MGGPYLFGVGLHVLSATGNRRIVDMDSTLRAAAEYILGLGRVYGLLAASENDPLLGLGHIGRNAFRRCANALRCRVCLRNGGGFSAIEDNPFLGRCSIGNRAGRRRTLHSEHLWSRPAASDNNAFLGRRSNRCIVLGMAV